MNEMALTERIESVIKTPSVLPAGWRVATLDQACDIIMGQSPSSQFYNSEKKGLPFFQGKAEFGPLYPEPVKWCTAPGKIAQKDDVLISVRAPVGPTNLAPSECCIGRGLAAIRPKNGMPSKYVLHYLRSIESVVEALGTGTTFKAISGKTLRAIPVPVAPPEQQERIVAEIEKQFSRLDEAVANLKRVKANLKRYKAAVLKAAVEGRLVETEAELARREGSEYETGSQLLQRILETRRSQWKGKGKYKEPAAQDTIDFYKLPAGWGWAAVDQLVAHLTDGDHQPPPQTEQGIPFLVIGNVRSGRIDFSDTRFVGKAYYKSLDQSRQPKQGDLLYTLVGSYGIPVRVQTDKPFCIQRHMAILRPHEKSPMDYLAVVMASDVVFRQATAAATGTAQKTVPLAGLRRIAIPLPPLAEQHRTVAEVDRHLSVVREVEAEVDTNLARAEHLRLATLTRAFSGRLLHPTEMYELEDQNIRALTHE